MPYRIGLLILLVIGHSACAWAGDTQSRDGGRIPCPIPQSIAAPCADLHTQGLIMVEIADEDRSQRVEKALHRTLAIYATQTQVSVTQPVLLEHGVADALKRISLPELRSLLSKLADPPPRWFQNGNTVLIEYGHDQDLRQKIHEALLQESVTLMDTAGDLFSPQVQRIRREQWIAAQYSSLEKDVGILLKERHLTVATAESCTGGLASSRLTDIPGSSQYIHFNVVTYSNAAKSRFLGVPAGFLKQHGPYNPQTAAWMAEGIRKTAKSDIGIGFTGLAGTESIDGVAGGTVFIGLAGLSEKPVVKKLSLDPTIPRAEQKQIFVEYGFYYLKQYLQNSIKSDF